jgi:hypothetical protein
MITIDESSNAESARIINRIESQFLIYQVQRGDQIHYNIKMELREIEWGFMDWIDLAQNRD